MSKFDRGVFIFIGLGIWTLAMVQIFQPSPVVAVNKTCGSLQNPCHVSQAHLSIRDGVGKWVMSHFNEGIVVTINK